MADSHDHSATHADSRAAELAEAKDAVQSSDAYPLMVDPLGDPLVDVQEPVALNHEGRKLLFASEENAQAFKADPEKYLGAVDQMIIKQQKPLYPMTTCVVSGEELGGEMGDPIDYVYGNRLVRFCCKMCKAKFNKDPDAYLAKINEAVVESQTPGYPMQTCVVSGEELGEDMGEPHDYVIGTRLVRFCCPMCVKKFEANPAHYLSMLGDHAGHEEVGDHMHNDDAHEAHHEEKASDADAGHDSHGQSDHH